MTIEYLDKSGLTLLISKIKTALGGKRQRLIDK